MFGQLRLMHFGWNLFANEIASRHAPSLLSYMSTVYVSVITNENLKQALHYFFTFLFVAKN